MTQIKVARAFVTAVNAHDILALSTLMSDDHRFVDSLGNVMTGRETIIAGWRGYFVLFPDYRIDVEGAVEDGEQVMLFGRASGTLHRDRIAVEGGAWAIPAACRAVVRAERVVLWQVYADNTPVHAMLNG